MIQPKISVLSVCYNAVFVIGMLPFRHCLWFMPQAVLARTKWRRPLMVRQP